MEEIKERFDDNWNILSDIVNSKGDTEAKIYLNSFIQSEINLAVSKERERRDAQIIEFINSGESAPWNDTGWSVELSDVEKFIINTK